VIVDTIDGIRVFPYSISLPVSPCPARVTCLPWLQLFGSHQPKHLSDMLPIRSCMWCLRIHGPRLCVPLPSQAGGSSSLGLEDLDASELAELYDRARARVKRRVWWPDQGRRGPDGNSSSLTGSQASKPVGQVRAVRFLFHRKFCGLARCQRLAVSRHGVV
jgi:hypothetical protein